MVNGISQVVVEVEDQERALGFWAEKLGFEVARDERYGDERWLEVRTPDGAVAVVLSPRRGEPAVAPNELATSNIMFYCDDLSRTYDELRARGVEFPQPPAEQPWGWWSMFEDGEGNRFALGPRDTG
jgi:predicted enzyme related to lactoylglutathione lyase